MSSWIAHNRPIKRHIISNENIPTFHILIATAGRPSLKNMLDSLNSELSSNDAITIVFDGEDALKNSTFSNKWLDGLKCKVSIIEQIPALGYWGHEIRNKYQGILEPKTTFIMNADDDDIYISGSFNTLRNLCKNQNTLYIAKMYNVKKDIIIPSQMKHILKNDIGTPCGIIPYSIASKSIWEPIYGGDFDYYNNIKKFANEVVFLNVVMYHIL